MGRSICRARGIELIAGADDGRAAWRKLLHHPRPEMVKRAALTCSDASYIPDLIEILQCRPEAAVQIAAMRTLGGSKHPAAFPLIVQRLATPELRGHAIQALADLSDVRAIPHIEPLLADTTPLWREDNHGPMVRVCDLATAAIARLRGDPATTAGAAIAPAASHIIPPADSDRPARGPAAFQPPPSIIRRKPHRPAYIPIVAALLEIPWVAAVVFSQLFLTGTFKPTEAQTHRLDAISMVPAAIGLVAGIVIVVRGRQFSLAERICLYVGCFVCGLFVFSFGWEMSH